MDATVEHDSVFGWVDYSVFLGMLLISAAIGAWYAFKGQNSADDILVGGKSMGVVPVAASIMATFMSATGLLGVPGEFFLYGTQMVFSYVFIVMPVMTFVSTWLIVPVFYDLGTCSANVYLERRFSKLIRGLSCVFYCLSTILLIGVTLYAPAMALTQVTGFHPSITIWTTGLVCTFYTAFGGMKAVVWTDAFQTVIMFGTMIWILVKGVDDAGGVREVWMDNWETDRIVFFDFDPSPFTRLTFWSCVVARFVSFLGSYATNQAMIQRYLSLPSLKDAKRAVWTALPLFTLLNVLTMFLALVVISKYRGCDPLKTKRISTADQLLPLFVMDTMGNVPGIPGIFVAGMFSASLSTVSSGLNSLIAVVLEDIIRPYIWPKLTEGETLKLLKWIATLFGFLVIGAAMMAGYMGNVIQATVFAFGLIGAPMCGVFLLGMFVPQATSQGALAGLAAGFVVNLWMGLGALLTTPYYPTKEKDYVDGCPEKYANATGHFFNMSRHDEIVQGHMDRTEAIFPLYRVSFLYYATVAMIVVFGVGVVVSVATGGQDINELDVKLFAPPIRRWLEKKRQTVKEFREVSDVDLEEMTKNEVEA